MTDLLDIIFIDMGSSGITVLWLISSWKMHEITFPSFIYCTFSTQLEPEHEFPHTCI